MLGDWSHFVKRYRLRHGLTQDRLSAALGVSQRTVSRWERGEDKPSLDQQRLLRDMGCEPPAEMLQRLSASVLHCPAPRALSRTSRLCLQALSPAAIAKRPSITNWIGRDLARVACGVLADMLDDKVLQRGIANREIACVETTTRSVLRTAEHASIGTFHTTITYFFHEGTLYSDAISAPAPADAICGYAPLPMDEIPGV